MKTIKTFLIVIVLLVGGYFLYNLVTAVKYRHKIEMYNYKPYLWIFVDSVKDDVDSNLFVGSIQERDILYEYILKSKYRISIWELKDLKDISLDNIKINKNTDLVDISIMPYELLNKNENPEITTELGFSFKTSINLNIDKRSSVIKSIEALNYKGFYGVVNKLSLSNEKGKHLILFDYIKKNEPTVFLFYKSKKGFYLIFINSKNVPFDESIINLLNLS